MIKTRTWIYQKVIIPKQQFIVFPFFKRIQIIRAYNQVKFMLWITLAQISKCINCIGRTRKSAFNIIHFDFDDIFSSQEGLFQWSEERIEGKGGGVTVR